MRSLVDRAFSAEVFLVEVFFVAYGFWMTAFGPSLRTVFLGLLFELCGATGAIIDARGFAVRRGWVADPILRPAWSHKWAVLGSWALALALLAGAVLCPMG